MGSYQDIRSRAFGSSVASYQKKVAVLGELRGGGTRARKSLIRANADGSRRYLELLELALEELAIQDGQAERALVLGVDFWLAGKESAANWLSELDFVVKETRSGIDDLGKDFDLAGTGNYPTDPPPPRLPAAGLYLTPRIFPAPRPARS